MIRCWENIKYYNKKYITNSKKYNNIEFCYKHSYNTYDG